MVYLWIGLGSALGGMARLWVSSLITHRLGEDFPWGTLAVNVLGSLLIGFVAAWPMSGIGLLGHPTGKKFLMLGIFGGFTTFSSFSLQTLTLLENGQTGYALANMGLSVVTCLIAVWAGQQVGEWMGVVHQ